MDQTRDENRPFRVELTDLISAYANSVADLQEAAEAMENAALDFENDDCEVNEQALVACWENVDSISTACRVAMDKIALRVVLG